MPPRYGHEYTSRKSRMQVAVNHHTARLIANNRARSFRRAGVTWSSHAGASAKHSVGDGDAQAQTRCDDCGSVSRTVVRVYLGLRGATDRLVMLMQHPSFSC